MSNGEQQAALVGDVFVYKTSCLSPYTRVDIMRYSLAERQRMNHEEADVPFKSCSTYQTSKISAAALLFLYRDE